MLSKFVLLPLFATAVSGALAQQAVVIADAYPDKARYAPAESVRLFVEFTNAPPSGASIAASLLSDGKEVGRCSTIVFNDRASTSSILSCEAPPSDFHGYLVDLRLRSATGAELSSRTTAIDISSDWKRFPRYGYVAHYSPAEGATSEWISEMNRFHLNGIQFYGFQYRHDQPLAGTVSSPATAWPDIARREVDKDIVDRFILEAHRYNMVAMAYNASYSSYEDAFQRSKNPLPVSWGTWSSATEPRTLNNIKSTSLPSNWATSKLFYMNQNDTGWQRYLFTRMNDLFKVYPFDGWQIDTFGERSAFAYNGTSIDFVTGMPAFIEHAHAATNKRVVMNAVNAQGQAAVARTSVEFVYSELWDDHETFASIQKLANEISHANPDKSYVIAAYLNRDPLKRSSSLEKQTFNTPAVLLTDAAIFALGASHIELGDGDRMLSSEYFPADTRLSVSKTLHERLRGYYDFLTAYENALRDDVRPVDIKINLQGYPCSSDAIPGTIWSTAHSQGKDTVTLQLINLLASKDGKWRDTTRSAVAPPLLRNLQVSVIVRSGAYSVGWATPDADQGRFHEIGTITQRNGDTNILSFALPELQYWDMIVFKKLSK